MWSDGQKRCETACHTHEGYWFVFRKQIWRAIRSRATKAFSPARPSMILSSRCDSALSYDGVLIFSDITSKRTWDRLIGTLITFYAASGTRPQTSRQP